MDKRGFVLVFLYFFSRPLLAQQILPPTEVDDTPITDIGSKQATRPAQTFSNDVLQIDQRPEIDQALDVLPGVQARIEGSPLLSIRGSESSARALVLEDGVPLNFSDGVGFNPLYLATENMASVTLLKGPSSSLFGHDALVGVLEFNTEKLKAPKFMTSYGSFNESQIFIGGPIQFQNFQVTAYESHTDNNFSYEIPRTGASGTRSQDNSETTRFTFSGGSSKESSFQWKTFNLVARSIGSTPGSLDFPVASAFNNWAEINSVELQNSWDNLSLGSRSSYKYLWQSYSGSSASATSSVRENLSVLEKFKGGNAELFDEFSYENFQANYLPGNQAYYPLNEVGASTFIELSDSISAQGAIRISNENGGVVPSIGLISVQDAIKYFINYSEGYRPPSITQLYAQYVGFSGNTKLTSEHSQEIDLGFEKTYFDISTHFEAFSRNLNNLIDNVVLVPGTFTPQNVGDASAYGFEINAETKIPFIAGASLSYLYSQELDTQTPVPLSPQFQASAHAGQTLGKWTLSGQGTYWSSYDDRSITTGQLVMLYNWLTFDLFAAYKLSSEINLRLAALNIFDEPKELSLGYPSPQRSFTLSVMGYL